MKLFVSTPHVWLKRFCGKNNNVIRIVIIIIIIIIIIIKKKHIKRNNNKMIINKITQIQDKTVNTTQDQKGSGK